MAGEGFDRTSVKWARQLRGLEHLKCELYGSAIFLKNLHFISKVDVQLSRPAEQYTAYRKSIALETSIWL
jgi:hypothetical protein